MRRLGMAFRRLISVTLALFLATAALPLFAANAETAAHSTRGSYIARGGGKIYYVTYGDDGDCVLNWIPEEGGAPSVMTTASYIDQLIYADGYLCYVTTLSGSIAVVSREQGGKAKALATFDAEVPVTGLSYYGDRLFALVGGKLTRFNPSTPAHVTVSDRKIADFVIYGSRVYFVDTKNTKSYTGEALLSDEQLKRTAGKLYSMKMDGTDVKVAIDKGVGDLSVEGDHLYLHNFEDHYVMGGEGDEWLEGKLYRYDFEAKKLASTKVDYEWGYFPTSDHLVVYTADGLQRLPAAGGKATQLMSMDMYASLAEIGDTLYVLNHDNGKLTAIDVSEGKKTALTGVRKDDDYIFASSGTDRLTEQEVRALDPSLLGYARNEILARHGYTFQKKTYRDYFMKKSWYSEDQSYSEKDLSRVEWDNIELIKKVENSRTSGGWIFPDSHQRKLTEKEVRALDAKLLPYARNEIYARRGYVFNKKIYADYFATREWYRPDKSFTYDRFTALEWSNIKLIQKIEDEVGDDDEMIFADSDKRLLTAEELRKLSAWELKLARNEIYARHGYILKSKDLREYFESKSWYKPDESFSENRISDMEWKNIQRIKKAEAAK